jgi:hypothetical protein
MQEPSVWIAGAPSAASDRALAAAFARILERKHPGTRWEVEGVKPRAASETAPAQILRPMPGRERAEREPSRIAA